MKLSGQGYLVWSPNCRIPDVDPFHPSIRRFVKKVEPIKCLHEKPLTYTKGYNLILDEKLTRRYTKLSCCYSEVKRITEDSNKYSELADDRFE